MDSVGSAATAVATGGWSAAPDTLKSVGGAVGGIAQQDTYNASAPAITTQNFNPGIVDSQGTIRSNTDAEMALAKQLQDQANGIGPNPAQAQYQNNVNQNAQTEAGSIASQKGINPALAARLIATQAANANQSAAGTQAVNQATQQNAATTQQAGVLNNIGNQANTNQSTLQTAQANQNNAINTGSLGVQDINAKVAAGNTAAQNGIIGGLLSGVAGAGAAALAAKGGVVPGKSEVPGDSIKNDKELYLLSAKEAVLPKSVMEAKDAPEKAKEFVAMLKAQGSKGTTTARNGYGKVLENQRMLHQRLAAIEQHLKGNR